MSPLPPGPRRGRPRHAQSEDEQCDAAIVLQWHHNRPGHNHSGRCPFQAKYLWGKYKFCYRHAVIAALNWALEKGIARKILRPLQASAGGPVTLFTKKKVRPF